MGKLLDSEQDDFHVTHLQVFEMQQILNKEEKFIVPLLHYLFHQLDRSLSLSKSTLIIVEEGHRFLKGQFGQQLEVWLRECRKQNAAVVFVTQGLSEIVNSPYKHILLNSCLTKMFLANHQATASYNRELYHEVGLNDTQIEMISKAVPKQDYFLTSPLGNRLMDLALSKTFLAFTEQADFLERERVLKLRNAYQDEWVFHWLSEKGLTDQANYWRECYAKL